MQFQEIVQKNCTNELLLTKKKRKLNENQDEKMIKENKKDQENYKFDKRKIIYDTHVMLGHANPRTTYGYLKDQYFCKLCVKIQMIYYKNAKSVCYLMIKEEAEEYILFL